MLVMGIEFLYLDGKFASRTPHMTIIPVGYLVKRYGESRPYVVQQLSWRGEQDMRLCSHGSFTVPSYHELNNSVRTRDHGAVAPVPDPSKDT